MPPLQYERVPRVLNGMMLFALCKMMPPIREKKWFAKPDEGVSSLWGGEAGALLTAGLKRRRSDVSGSAADELFYL